MPSYEMLAREPEDVRRRAADRLLQLRARLDAIPARTVEDTLLLATWNIREFDSGKYGDRCPECFLYIAEIVGRFDLVAVQEVKEDLRALDRLQGLLGAWWKYIVTDVTAGTSGNGERMAFLYDSRKVAFSGIAGEIVLPDPRVAKDAPPQRALQFARTPFLCGFKAGWARFNLCTVHIYYGKAKAEDPRRVQEIRDLAQMLAKRARTRKGAGPMVDFENLILLGDFNIFNRGDATMAAIEEAGFVVPEALKGGEGSNLSQDRHYDQIAFYPHDRRFGATGRAGVLDYYDVVFRDDEEATYAPLMGEKYAAKPDAKKRSTYYQQWRTFQMSDHLVLWAELRVGFADEHLRGIAAGGAGEGGA